MQAKVSIKGLRFFAHDRQVPNCPSTGETPEHRALKRYIAAAVREAGGTAVIEAEPAEGDQGGWRADVLALCPDGRRVAFEAQLAAMTREDGLTRTRRYGTDRVETIWVTSRDAPWLYELPGVKVIDVDDAESSGTPQATKRVCRGYAQLPGGGSRATGFYPGWRLRTDLDFDRLIRGIVTGKVTTWEVPHLDETLPWRATTRLLFHRRAVVLVPESHAERARAHEAAELRRQEQENERVRRWQAHVDALVERRRATMPIAVGNAAAEAKAGESVWVGVPPTDTGRTGELPDERNLGNEKTAFGAAIWLGEHRDALRLYAIVCPVAGRINNGLAASWRRRGVRVYVTDRTEGRRVTDALRWPLSALTIVETSPRPAPPTTTRGLQIERR